MMNLKETLKKLHKKFPNLTLDELFDVADCYVEEINIYTYSTNIPNPYKNYTNTFLKIGQQHVTIQKVV